MIIIKNCTIKQDDRIEQKSKAWKKQKSGIGLAVGIVTLTKEKERSTYRPVGRSCIYEFLFSVCAMVTVKLYVTIFLSFSSLLFIIRKLLLYCIKGFGTVFESEKCQQMQ